MNFNLMLQVFELKKPASQRTNMRVQSVAFIICLTNLILNFFPTVLSSNEFGTSTSLRQLLFEAIKVNNIEAVRTAVEAGASISGTNSNGQTALDIAIKFNRFKIANYLIFARRIEHQTILQEAPKLSPLQKKSKAASRRAKTMQNKNSALTLTERANLNITTNSPKITTNIPDTGATSRNDVSHNEVINSQKKNRGKFRENAIFIKDKNGNLAPAKPEDIDLFIRSNLDHTPSVKSDVEPRKAFFIPKPRKKPIFRNLVKNSSEVNQKQRKVSDNEDRERRISENLIIKLRKGLEKSKLENRNTVEGSNRIEDKEDLSTSKSRYEPLTRRKFSRTNKLEEPNNIKTKNHPSRRINQSNETTFLETVVGGIVRFFDFSGNKSIYGQNTHNVYDIKRRTDIIQEQPPIRAIEKKSEKRVATTIPLQTMDQARSKELITAKNEREKIMEPIQTTNQVGIKKQGKEKKRESETKTIRGPIRIKNLNTASRQNNQGYKMPITRLRKPLKNVTLAIGSSITTGQLKLPRGMAEPDPCVKKRKGKLFFCVVPIDWPHNFENIFAVNTSLYQGARAIVRYDRGKASHFHIIYKSRNHKRVLDFFHQRYGKPTDIWKRVIAPFGKPRQPNPTFVWRSHDQKKDEVTILEVRKFDDSRTVFPDTEHGAIRLYTAGGPPVFPIITAHDIMSIEWAARSDHLDSTSPALARTMRVQQ